MRRRCHLRTEVGALMPLKGFCREGGTCGKRLRAPCERLSSLRAQRHPPRAPNPAVSKQPYPSTRPSLQLPRQPQRPRAEHRGVPVPVRCPGLWHRSEARTGLGRAEGGAAGVVGRAALPGHLAGGIHYKAGGYTSLT